MAIYNTTALAEVLPDIERVEQKEPVAALEELVGTVEQVIRGTFQIDFCRIQIEGLRQQQTLAMPQAGKILQALVVEGSI